ncbi:MAG TPA: ATP-binding protein [Burkholderiaceae bacterium]|nr:ATP-binding protein [Burkholderiaceae bacterium]
MRISLFLRTFLMIAPLVFGSVVAALQLVRVFDQSPPDRQLAWELASVINLTRSALVSSEGERRQALLIELARDEGVRVLPLEPGDRIEPLARVEPARAALADAVQARLRNAFDSPTQLAGRVNGEDGLWVSFDIDDDAYWLRLDRERFDRQEDPNWWLVFGVALGLSGIGALAISQLVNRPLARIAQAIEQLSRGGTPGALPQETTTEIAEVNRRFNRLAAELAAIDSDRAVGLAGISHDIRTPLARLRLEIELSALPEPDKASMAEDIERIDRIVGQFVEYGRVAAEPAQQRIEPVAVDEVVAGVAAGYHGRIDGGELKLVTRVDPPDARWRGNPLDLTRVLGNLIENALRYGTTPGQPFADVELRIARQRDRLLVAVADRGAGVPAEHRERLLRPFARLDTERTTQRGGSGLGLAIVARIARRYDGDCELSETPQGGLTVSLTLRDAPARSTGGQ